MWHLFENSDEHNMLLRGFNRPEEAFHKDEPDKGALFQTTEYTKYVPILEKSLRKESLKTEGQRDFREVEEYSPIRN